MIECICSDEAAHRKQLEERQPGIPGWHELDWSEVVRVKAYYAPWDEERLLLDAVNPLEENIAATLAYLRGYTGLDTRDAAAQKTHYNI